MNLIVILIAGVAGLAGLVAARLGHERMARGSICNAIAVGVLVGLLVGMVPRLTGSASVVLAQLTPALPGEARSLVASIGPLVIQNLAAALVIGVYIGALCAQRGRAASDVPQRHAAPLFALALGAYGVADSMAGAASSLPATTSIISGQIGGLVLAHVCRGLALSGAFATRSDGLGWLVSAALLGGLLNGLGAELGRQLGFAQTNTLGLPVLAGAVGLLVASIVTILGSNVRQLPVAGFLAGLGLTLVAAHLQG